MPFTSIGTGADALVDEPPPDDHVRAGQHVVVPRVLEGVRDVRPDVGPQQRRVPAQAPPPDR